jgi:acyl-CoA thioesterase II
MPSIEDLLRSLDLQPADGGGFIGTNADEHGVIFGGQLLGQSIVAAAAGHPGKTVKTVHTIFARAGSATDPVEIAVDPVHDGRTFASTGVTISQSGRVCARSLVLLTADEPDLMRHADPAPELAGPDESKANAMGAWKIQVVGDVDVSNPEQVLPPDLDVWTRFDGAPDDPLTNQALVAYSTDAFLIGTAMLPHDGIGQAQAHKTLQTGVISHTLTFHEPLAAGEWFLLSHHGTYAGNGRVYGRANVFRPDGVLAASFVQDAMVRGRDPGSSAPL